MPEAILLSDVDGVGEKGTVVDVSKGYLRNYLLPRKLAAPATKGAIDQAKARADQAEQAARDQVQKAGEWADTLNRTVLSLNEKAGEDGRLFGSITTQDIADAIQGARGITVDKRDVHLPEPIRSVGTHMVVVELNGGLTATVKTIVAATS